MSELVGNRIREARERRRLSRGDLAKILNTAQSSLQSWEAGAVSPKVDIAMKIAEVLGISIPWLLGLTDDSENHTQGQSLPASPCQCPATNDTACVMVPLYDIRASAGHGELVESEAPINSLPFQLEWIKRRTTSSPDKLSLIRVQGDSMYPKLYDQDVVLVDRGQTTLRKGGDYGNIYVIRVDNNLYIKHVDDLGDGSLRISSTNATMHPPITLPASEVEIIGRTIWHAHNHG
jgi:phage repressor protein C with HTH and peptisase S24 domain